MIQIKKLIAFGLSFCALSVNANPAAYEQAVNSAYTHLYVIQNPDGSWGASNSIRYIVTSNIVDSLKANNRLDRAYFSGVAWLENHSANNIDAVSRKVVSLLPHGNNVNPDVIGLLANKIEPTQVGWGLSASYQSDVLDTALVTNAIDKAGYVFSEEVPVPNLYVAEIDSAITYLLSKRLANAGWTIESSLVSDYQITAIVHQTLSSLTAPPTNIATAMSESAIFLSGIPINSSSLMLAHAGLALFKYQGQTAVVDSIANELLARQGAIIATGDLYTISTSMQIFFCATWYRCRSSWAKCKYNRCRINTNNKCPVGQKRIRCNYQC